MDYMKFHGSVNILEQLQTFMGEDFTRTGMATRPGKTLLKEMEWKSVKEIKALKTKTRKEEDRYLAIHLFDLAQQLLIEDEPVFNNLVAFAYQRQITDMQKKHKLTPKSQKHKMVREKNHRIMLELAESVEAVWKKRDALDWSRSTSLGALTLEMNIAGEMMIGREENRFGFVGALAAEAQLTIADIDSISTTLTAEARAAMLMEVNSLYVGFELSLYAEIVHTISFAPVVGHQLSVSWSPIGVGFSNMVGFGKKSIAEGYELKCIGFGIGGALGFGGKGEVDFFLELDLFVTISYEHTRPPTISIRLPPMKTYRSIQKLNGRIEKFEVSGAIDERRMAVYVLPAAYDKAKKTMVYKVTNEPYVDRAYRAVSSPKKAMGAMASAISPKKAASAMSSAVSSPKQTFVAATESMSAMTSAAMSSSAQDVKNKIKSYYVIDDRMPALIDQAFDAKVDKIKRVTRTEKVRNMTPEFFKFFFADETKSDEQRIEKLMILTKRARGWHECDAEVMAIFREKLAGRAPEAQSNLQKTLQKIDEAIAEIRSRYPLKMDEMFAFFEDMAFQDNRTDEFHKLFKNWDKELALEIALENVKMSLKF
jgi:hypothetical protein